nr:MAG TPA: hypothetical protein [Siphoviridae sp. ctwl93]
MILKSVCAKIYISFQPTKTKDKNTYNALTLVGAFFL